MFLSLAKSVGADRGDWLILSLPFICGPRLPHHHHHQNTHTHFHFVCVSSSPVCVHVRRHQQMVEGWGGQGFFAPALPSSAHWLSGPSVESDNTLMAGHHLPQQQQGRRWGCGKAASRSHTPPSRCILLPISPLLLSRHWFLFFRNHVIQLPPPPKHTHTPSPHRCVWALCFSCCNLTSVDCLWLAFHTRGHRGLSNDALNN